jgi:hypothetical protein
MQGTLSTTSIAVAEAGINFRCGGVYKDQRSNTYNTIMQELTATLYKYILLVISEHNRNPKVKH